MTTACICVYIQSDIPLGRYRCPFLCALCVVGLPQVGRVVGEFLFPWERRIPGFYIRPRRYWWKTLIGKCGPCAQTQRERVDRVVSTTVVNPVIFYLAANYNVEWGEELLIRYQTSCSCSSLEEREVTHAPARSCSLPGKNGRISRYIGHLHGGPRQFCGVIND